MGYIEELGIKAARAKVDIANCGTRKKNEALIAIAKALRERCGEALEANEKDLENAKANGMSKSMQDRLALSEARIESIAKACEELVSLEDPILKKWWAVADGGHLGGALGELCGSLGSSNAGVPQGIVAKIGELWDLHNERFSGPEKSGSLRGIVRLAKSGYYEVSWWGPRLLRELRVNAREVPVIAFRDELRVLSSYDPELAVEVLWRIAEKDAHPISSFYSDIGIELLQADIRKNGGALSEAGLRCMDTLGALGCLDLDESVFQKSADS